MKENKTRWKKREREEIRKESGCCRPMIWWKYFWDLEIEEFRVLVKECGVGKDDEGNLISQVVVVESGLSYVK